MRKLFRTAFALWLPVAAVATVLAFALYGAVQQDQRSTANDPQLQMATDAARTLSAGAKPGQVASGPSVDLSTSLAPYLVVVDAKGKPLASTAELGGKTPVPPAGVLQSARSSGRNEITWEPRPGVRSAIVVTPFSSDSGSGFVIAGRSLREIEHRETWTLLISIAAWLMGLAAAALACFLAAWILRPEPGEPAAEAATATRAAA